MQNACSKKQTEGTDCMQLSKLFFKKKQTKSKHPTMRPRAKLNPYDDSHVWCVYYRREARGLSPFFFFAYGSLHCNEWSAVGSRWLLFLRRLPQDWHIFTFRNVSSGKAPPPPKHAGRHALSPPRRPTTLKQRTRQKGESCYMPCVMTQDSR